MKFEHLKFTKKEVEKLQLEVISRDKIHRILNKIHKQCMKKYHSNYCPDAVYRDMENRCIIYSNDTHDLISKKRFDKIIKRYKKGKVHWPGDFKVKEFNTITTMFIRGQVSEC